MGTKNDELILSLKKEIEQKKTTLKKVEKFNPITNCNLELGGKRFNIHVCDKETLLFLIAKMANLKTGLASILPNETLTFGGFKIDDWIKDLKGKFDYLNISLEQKRLKALEDRLHNLLSIDKKVELEIEDLKGQI